MLETHQLTNRASRWTCFKASLNTSWQCFADATSIHGLQYISTERKIYQKFVWLICISASFACLFTLSYHLYFHYMAAPTKTIVRSQHYPSALIPFPAITVCPPNKISTRKVRSFLRPFLQYYERATNTSSDENGILRATSQMNDLMEYSLASEWDMWQLEKVLKFGKFSLGDFIQDMSLDCNEWFLKCIWNRENVPCQQLFRSVLTSEGQCCSFNYEGVHLHKYTSLYASGFGLYSGLSFVLANNDEMLSATRNNIRVLLHDPFSFPENIKTDFLVPRLKETAISMRLVYSLADFTLRELSAKTRNCVFRDEYHLDYFQAYTFENCLTECQLKRYYELCGCIPHYLAVENRKVCKPTQLFCITQYSTQVLVQESGNETLACICPNECDMFLIKTSLSEWNFYPMNESRIELYKGISEDSTIIHIYFGQSHNHLYNKVLAIRGLNFTSNIGGLVSLFLGSSLISILEVIYYFTYRLYRMYQRIRADTRVLFRTKSYFEFNKNYKL